MLICLTANHKNTDFRVLEALTAQADHIESRIVGGVGQGGSVRGAVVVSTCNRFEAYLDVVGSEVTTSEELESGFGLTEASKVARKTSDLVPHIFGDSGLDKAFRVIDGPEVVQHLFSVASGLESVVVGEGEIAGQVRRALENARHEGTTTTPLEQLFQRASTVSRTVKTRTVVGSAGRSLVRLALDLSTKRVGDWKVADILLIGTGQYAAATLAAIRERGGEKVRVFSPSGRGARFAASHDITSVTQTEFPAVAAKAKLIITCTTADHYVVDAETLRSGVEAGVANFGPTSGPMIIDLGLPRNVNPDVVTHAGVALLDLESIRIHAPAEEVGAYDEARAIVAGEADAFLNAADEREANDAVIALRKHITGLVDSEIERASRRGDSDGKVAEALRHMAGVLLHTPTVRSREYARIGESVAWASAVTTVFGIETE